MKHSADVAQKWHGAVANIGNHFLKMQGLDVGACEIVLHVRPCEGLIRQLDGTVEKRFAAKELLCPIQVGGASTCRSFIPAHFLRAADLQIPYRRR